MIAFLSATLLFGALVNVIGAWGFLVSPVKTAADLGLPIESEDAPRQSRSARLLLRLTGACLIALAMFYFVTGLGPLQQPINVVIATMARLLGVAFYAIVLVRQGGPNSFKKYLFLNLALAAGHTIGLVFAPGGFEALREEWNSLWWVGEWTAS